MVIGSETPWIEAILLNLGAANVTTLGPYSQSFIFFITYKWAH